MCVSTIHYVFINADSDDYESLSTPITFSDMSINGTVLCINVAIIGDTTPEHDETFSVTFTPENSRDMISGTSTVTITILNDDGGEMD